MTRETEEEWQRAKENSQDLAARPSALVAASARGSRYRFRLTEVRRRRGAHRGSHRGGYSLGVGEIGEVTWMEAGEKAHQTRGSVGGISWGG